MRYLQPPAGLIRRIINRLRRKDPKDEGEPEEGEEGWDPDKGGWMQGEQSCCLLWVLPLPQS